MRETDDRWMPGSAAISDAVDELGVLPRVNGRLSGATIELTPIVETPTGISGSAHLGVVRDAHPARGVGPSGIAAFIEGAAPGDIIVLAWEAGPIASCCGGAAARYASLRGCTGLITDGWVRDVAEIRTLGFPIWARGVTPRSGKGRLRIDAVEGPIRLGDVEVSEGDLVVADETGISVVGSTVSPEVLRLAREIEKGDGILTSALDEGLSFDLASRRSRESDATS